MTNEVQEIEEIDNEEDATVDNEDSDEDEDVAE